MFKREMKINFKNCLIWTLILIGIFLVVFLIYPSIISNENIKMMDEFVDMFPKEMIVAFNLDIASIDSAFGWLKTEGFVMILLITGAYSSILGSNILSKEESDKTIEYLNSIPITRTNIVVSKILSGTIYITLMIILLGIFNLIGLVLSGDFNIKMYLLLSITPLFSSLVIFALSMFLSTFTRKNKKMLGISLGIVFISYILNLLSGIAENVEFLKYFSVFTLADIRNVITNVAINPLIVFITIILTLTLWALTIKKYNSKELI